MRKWSGVLLACVWGLAGCATAAPPMASAETWGRWYLSSHITANFTVVSEPWQPLDFHASLPSCQAAVTDAKMALLNGPLGAKASVTSDHGYDVVIAVMGASRLGQQDEAWVVRYRCLPASIGRPE
jgi:hypothetical protein